MEVGGEGGRCGEKPLVLLALALPKELFVPLRHHGKAGVVADQHFRLSPFAVEKVADSRVTDAAVAAKIRGGQLLPGSGGAVHQRLNIPAADGDGQKPHRGENRVPAPHIVGDDKPLIPLPNR